MDGLIQSADFRTNGNNRGRTKIKTAAAARHVEPIGRKPPLACWATVQKQATVSSAGMDGSKLPQKSLVGGRFIKTGGANPWLREVEEPPRRLGID